MTIFEIKKELGVKELEFFNSKLEGWAVAYPNSKVTVSTPIEVFKAAKDSDRLFLREMADGLYQMLEHGDLGPALGKL